ncbi:MAG: TetR/AcrR family transcriptional regulator [Anaerolineae bacterium]|nr:TetR/AcrR family transcriptional regulator [Anaerolineae bacterium]
MGRKSLAPERREQILDAFAVCLRHYGFEGTTLERVAEEAGVQRSIIRHYIGNRDDLNTAAIDRIIAAYKAELAAAIENLPQSELIPELLNYLFCLDEDSELSDYDTLVNALWATHERNPHTKSLLLNLYQAFESLIDDLLALTFPASPEAQRRSVAYAVMCLANDTWSMISLGFPPSRADLARQNAEQLIASLNENAPVSKTSAN